ncbi:hypothetical protein [Actinomadura livida]|uniref:Uncharacterized protein n=1 Tax=Actinomadura livida TaxID=79909 RepID=A0A7W7ICV9_9ACTN|nr:MULTISPECIES: hypothetical protein [Actinomadura]MBB4774690.1 hypothetical protein [Actinomadura catellatispora]GGU06608.1 hypothetical protein GCM10010208_33850 [Actinomadura livida]
MDTPVNPADQALAQLRQDFQGHRIWRATRYDGKLGDWVATLHDPRAGVEPTVIRNSAEELRKALTIELNRVTKRTTGQRSRWDRW